MVPLTITPVLLLIFSPPKLAAEVPSVTLMNAAKPDTKMPVSGIGTGGYVHKQGTGIPGEIWNDTVSEKAISEWLILGGRRIDGAIDYGDQVGVGKAIKVSGIQLPKFFLLMSSIH